MTASFKSISVFRSSGLELLPALLSAAALQPSAVPPGRLSVAGTAPRPGCLSHKRLNQEIFRGPFRPGLFCGSSKPGLLASKRDGEKQVQPNS